MRQLTRVMRSITWCGILGVSVVIASDSSAIADEQSDSLYAEAQVALDNEDFDKAKKLLEQAVEFDPDNCRYHYALGSVQGMRANDASIFSKLGTAKSSKEHLERAVELCPDSVEFLTGLMEYHLEAPGVAGGSKDEARSLQKRVFALDSTEGYYAEATIAMGEERPDQAKDVFRRMLAAGLDTVNVLRNLGYLTSVNPNGFKGAGAYYRRVLAVEPDDWSVVYQLARVDVLGKASLDEAVSLLRRYIDAPEDSTRPPHAPAWWRLGMAHQLLGELDSARSCYERSLELDPEAKDVRKSLEELGKR